MHARRVVEGVHWVGAMDWDRRLFDSLIPLPDGTSYNAYYVEGNNKSALIDTVDPSMQTVLFERLKSLKVSSIDYIVANHAEQDHSGTIPAVLEAFPMAKVVTSQIGKSMVVDLLDISADRIITVNDGNTIDLGGKTLQFISFPWVHWPETMLTWVPEQKILLSCDLFGSHLASSSIFVSDGQSVLPAAKRYYAEIMMPFRKMIASNLKKVSNLGANLIAPSHGPIYKNPSVIIDAYREWTAGDTKNLVLVPYISMHESTRIMVEYFMDACAERGVNAEQFDLNDSDIGKLAMSLVDASGLVLGSPMVLAGPHPKVAYAAILANALRPKVQYLSVIGSYGWGGKLTETLQSLVPGLNAEIFPAVLAKGLPKEKEFAALDKLADSFHDHLLQTQNSKEASNKSMQKYVCTVCRYIYNPENGDPDSGIAPGTAFEDIPEDWVCPICQVSKDMFEPLEEE
ncbi:MAG: rubredoxin [Acidobacteriota bacterium]